MAENADQGRADFSKARRAVHLLESLFALMKTGFFPCTRFMVIASGLGTRNKDGERQFSTLAHGEICGIQQPGSGYEESGLHRLLINPLLYTARVTVSLSGSDASGGQERSWRYSSSGLAR